MHFPKEDKLYGQEKPCQLKYPQQREALSNGQFENQSSRIASEARKSSSLSR